MVMIHCQARNLVFISRYWVFDSDPRPAAPTSTSFPQAALASPPSRFASPPSRFGDSLPGCLMDLPSSSSPTCFKCRKCLISSLFIRMHRCMHLSDMLLLVVLQFRPEWPTFLRLSLRFWLAEASQSQQESLAECKFDAKELAASNARNIIKFFFTHLQFTSFCPRKMFLWPAWGAPQESPLQKLNISWLNLFLPDTSSKRNYVTTQMLASNEMCKKVFNPRFCKVVHWDPVELSPLGTEVSSKL